MTQRASQLCWGHPSRTSHWVKVRLKRINGELTLRETLNIDIPVTRSLVDHNTIHFQLYECTFGVVKTKRRRKHLSVNFR